MSANSTGYQAILVGNVGRNATHTPGHRSSSSGTRSRAARAACAAIPRAARALPHLRQRRSPTPRPVPQIRRHQGQRLGPTGHPHTARGHVRARAFNTMIVEAHPGARVPGRRRRLPTWSSSGGCARIHELTLASEQDHIAALKRPQAAREMNALDDTGPHAAPDDPRRRRTPDEPIQPELLHGRPAHHPHRRPRTAGAEVIEEDEGEPMPAFWKQPAGQQWSAGWSRRNFKQMSD